MFGFIYIGIVKLCETWTTEKAKCWLENGTESKNTSLYILLDHSNAFGLSKENNFFCREHGEGRGIIDMLPFWGPRASWLDQTGIGIS